MARNLLDLGDGVEAPRHIEMAAAETHRRGVVDAATGGEDVLLQLMASAARHLAQRDEAVEKAGVRRGFHPGAVAGEGDAVGFGAEIAVAVQHYREAVFVRGAGEALAGEEEVGEFDECGGSRRTIRWIDGEAVRG